MVIYDGHLDFANTGVCVVVPFGDFDPTASARIVLEELGVEVELAPGVPFLFPSALFYHYNTTLCCAGVCYSFVAWMGASLVQWYKLDGRVFCDLCLWCQKFMRSTAMKARCQCNWKGYFTQHMQYL